jgi:hypothetical protein
MPERSLRSLCALQVLLAACGGLAAPVLAQSESFLLGPGSRVGPATEVKPTNCVTAPDGTVTCDTELVNPPGDTRAQPQFELFRN